MFQQIKKSNGFSLVEVMIAAGILGALSLGVVKIIDMQTASSKKMDLQLTEGEIFRRVTTNLADSDACFATLAGIKTTKQILKKNGMKLYKVGDKIDHIRIKDITISKINGSGNKTITIELKLERLGKVSGVKVISKKFKIDAGIC